MTGHPSKSRLELGLYGPLASRDEELIGRIAEAALFGTADPRPTAPGTVKQDRETGPNVGRYVLRTHLGSGGMGSVYAADDPLLGRQVAIKLLHYEYNDHARLRREAAALARLNHPNVVPVFDVGEHDGRSFVVMELVDGRSMRDWLHDDTRSSSELLRAFEQAGRGLAAAHDAGLIHRDFKLSNVLVDSSGRVRVVDFGLARAIDVEPGLIDDGARTDVGDVVTISIEMDHRTQTNALVGTPAYMAPEQWTNRRVDARADQFAFCVALYEALFGHRPFTGTDRASLLASIEAQRVDPPPRRDVPAHVLPALRRGLKWDPLERWPSMDTLLAALAGPRPRRALWALVPMAALLATSTMAWADPSPSPSSGTCERSAAMWEEIWSPSRRQSITDALSRSGAPASSTTAHMVEQSLERYADSWAIEHARVCDAATEGGLDDDAELRLSCLLQGAWDLDALAELLQEADADLTYRAPRLVSELPDPRHCQLTRQWADTSNGPAQRDAQDDLWRALAQARVAAKAGRSTQVEARVPELASRAEALGDRRALMEIELLRGWVAAEGRRFEAAAVHYEQAYLMAIELGQDQAAATALQRIPSIIGYHLRRTDEGERWARLAFAFAIRTRAPPTLEIATHEALASFANLRGDSNESARMYEHALSRLHAHTAEPSLDEARILGKLGLLRLGRGETEPGLASLRASIEMASELLGPQHPDVARLQLNLGAWLGMLGRTEEALLPLRAAKATLERQLGPEHVEVLAVADNLGAALSDIGRWSDARSILEQNIRLLESASTTQILLLGNGLNNLARIEARAGNFERAEQLVRRSLSLIDESTFAESNLHIAALTIISDVLVSRARGDEALAMLQSWMARWTRSRGADDDAVVQLRLRVGHVLVALGRDAEARPHLAVESRFTDHDVHSLARAQALFDLATIELRSGGDGARAQRLVEQVVTLTEHNEAVDAGDLRAEALTLAVGPAGTRRTDE